MRITIAGTTYDGKDLDRLTLAEILRLEQETTAFGRPMKWSQLRAMSEAAEAMDDDEFLESDDAPWLIGLVVWVSRLRAGESISFADAIDFPIGDLDIESDRPDPSQDRTGAAGPRAARPGKRPADRARPSGGAKKAAAAKKRTSAPRSSDD